MTPFYEDSSNDGAKGEPREGQGCQVAACRHHGFSGYRKPRSGWNNLSLVSSMPPPLSDLRPATQDPCQLDGKSCGDIDTGTSACCNSRAFVTCSPAHVWFLDRCAGDQTCVTPGICVDFSDEP